MMQAVARYYSETKMQFDLVETILVRELKPADRYKYVGRWLYRGIMDEIGKATSGQQGQAEATESQATCHAASLNDTQSLS
jgi:hypothetical protein